jgi:hypothetical protein
MRPTPFLASCAALCLVLLPFVTPSCGGATTAPPTLTGGGSGGATGTVGSAGNNATGGGGTVQQGGAAGTAVTPTDSCMADEDCTWGEIPKEILISTDCLCLFGCDYLPQTKVTAARRMAQYQALCNPHVDGNGEPCAVDDCATPGKVACTGGTCKAAPIDAGMPQTQCVLSRSSSLPQVHIDFLTNTCTFTLAQASAGISIPYDLVIDDDVPGFVPNHPYYYGPDAAGLEISEVLSGGTQRYCVCDKGLPSSVCPSTGGGSYRPAPGDNCTSITLQKGVYQRTFSWDGHNWFGPSDTNNPKGPFFPAGDYALRIKIDGQLMGGDARSSLSVVGEFRVQLVP